MMSGDEIQCTNCGSKKKTIELNFEDNGDIFEQINGKVKEKGIKKPIEEFRIGDDLHRNSGKWNHVERYIIRKKNSKDSTYKEIIKDIETGEVIRHCEEPLINHINHGSAKG
jgi:hypothetical protein